MVLLANLFVLLICEYFPRTILQLAEPVGIDGYVGNFIDSGVYENDVAIRRCQFLLASVYTDGVFLCYLIHAWQSVDVAETPFIDLGCLDDFVLVHINGGKFDNSFFLRFICASILAATRLCLFFFASESSSSRWAMLLRSHNISALTARSAFNTASALRSSSQ